MPTYNVYPDNLPNMPIGFIRFTNAMNISADGDTLNFFPGVVFSFTSNYILSKSLNLKNSNPNSGTKPILTFTGNFGVVIATNNVIINDFIINGSSSDFLINITGTTKAITTLSLTNIELNFNKTGIRLAAAFSNLKNSSITNFKNIIFNRENTNSATLLTCILLIKMDTNLNVERCKVQEFNANNRFIYVTGGASVTESLKLGSLNLLGNEVLTNSQDCFYFQDYFSYNNAKKFSLICKDSPRTSVFDQTQYNQSNSKYFIRFRNITSTNFDQFASIIVRNNIVRCGSAFIILDSGDTITKNYNKVIQFTDDNQEDINYNIPNVFTIDNGKFLGYTRNARLPNETFVKSLISVVNKIQVNVPRDDILTILNGIKTNDAINVEDSNINTLVFRPETNSDVQPTIQTASATTVSQTLTITSFSTNDIFLGGFSNNVINSTVVVDSKTVVSNFEVKAYTLNSSVAVDSTTSVSAGYSERQTVDIQLNLSNATRRNNVAVYVRNNTTNLVTRVARLTRAPNSNTRYNVRLPGKSEYLVLDEPENGTLGDPYIKPITGDIYKLPDVNAIYRLYDNQNPDCPLIINGEVKVLENQAYQQMIANSFQINSELFKDNIPKEYLELMTPSFFNKIYIYNNGQEILVDLEEKQVYNTTDKITVHQYTDKNNLTDFYKDCKSQVYELDLENEHHGTFAVKVHFYENLQIRNGISIDIYSEKCRGLFYSYADYPYCHLTEINDRNLLQIEEEKEPEIKKITEKFYISNGSVIEKEMILVS